MMAYLEVSISLAKLPIEDFQNGMRELRWLIR